MADLIIDDWEKLLLAFCDAERIEEFFDIRNAIREMMGQREALLALVPEAKYTQQQIGMWRKELEGERGNIWQDLLLVLLDRADKALAALPEHLRGNNKERIRK